ncbi:MAG: flagellar biosynthesis anti-sigma factor FlgM [Edaphobacter sp.]
MSYTNGVGGLQQLLNSMTSKATPPAEPAAGSKRQDAAIANAGRVANADHTDLSSAGGLIAQALQGSDTRTAKVAALQQAIASGTYNVSSSDVAGKMIQSLLE